MRKLLLVVPLIMLGAGSTACATKKFVRGEVGQVVRKCLQPMHRIRYGHAEPSAATLEGSTHEP